MPAEVTTTTPHPVVAIARSTGSASAPGASSTTHPSGTLTTSEASRVVGGRVAMSGAVSDGSGSSRVGMPALVERHDPPADADQLADRGEGRHHRDRVHDVLRAHPQEQPLQRGAFEGRSSPPTRGSSP